MTWAVHARAWMMKGDPRYLLSEISDSHTFFETKRQAMPEICDRIYQVKRYDLVGAVANCTTVYDEEGKESEKFDNVLSAKG